MAIDIALFGFSDLGRSVTPTFLFRNRFYLQLSSHCPKINKNQCGKLKNFKIFVHGTWNPAILIGPLKPYLAENISLQSSNCNILGLAATVDFFDNDVRFTQI